MTDEEISAKIPDGYYRVDEGPFKEGDLFIYDTDDHDSFSPIEDVLGDWIGTDIEEGEIVARPIRGYKPEPEKPATVKEWLETLPDGYRERAIRQGDKKWLDDECKDLWNAIYDFQEWDITDEGVDFWKRMAQWSIHREGLPPLPDQEPLNPASDTPAPLFPTDAAARKEYPVGTFIRDYFPHAIAALAHHSYKAQQQHGPASNGAPMEWLKDKSVGDGNQAIRHFMEGDTVSAAWRMLELLERELTDEQNK